MFRQLTSAGSGKASLFTIPNLAQPVMDRCVHQTPSVLQTFAKIALGQRQEQGARSILEVQRQRQCQ
jgi:hypothetical protein